MLLASPIYCAALLPAHCLAVLLLASVLLLSPAKAQDTVQIADPIMPPIIAPIIAQDTVRPLELPRADSELSHETVIEHEFEFARMVYDGGWEWPRWRADYPDAEYHFSNGLRRLTRIQVSNDSKLLKLDDDVLFDYPWLYVVEVGFWTLSRSDRDQLREYLLRGGFLMIDDFHGTREWANFSTVIRQVFPDRSLVALERHSALFDIHFDVIDRVQIPGIRSVMNNRTWEKGGTRPGWFGILDDDGRVMVVVNFNQDIGDAWEHADDVNYPEPYTAMAYRLGVNYVLYAMTH